MNPNNGESNAAKPSYRQGDIATPNEKANIAGRGKCLVLTNNRAMSGVLPTLAVRACRRNVKICPLGMATLSAPFPYFGGKSRLAPAIWQRLGNPVVYVEPFAGSLACLLARPDGAGQREIVCDLDGGISNFWRAVTAEPDTVAALG